MQTENQPTNEETPQAGKENAVEGSTSNKTTKKKRDSKFQKFIRTAGLALLSVLIGMLVITLVLYLPARSDLNTARSELERLSEIEAQYNSLQEKSTLMEKQVSIYKLISNTGVLESALNEGDSTRVSQQLRYIETDLEQLSVPDFPEVVEHLNQQFSQVRAAAISDPQAALDENRIFLNDLLLLADNLE